MANKMSKEEKIRKLRRENKALKETCDILADRKIIADIKKSIDEIKSGKFVTLSDL